MSLRLDRLGHSLCELAVRDVHFAAQCLVPREADSLLFLFVCLSYFDRADVLTSLLFFIDISSLFFPSIFVQKFVT